MAQTQIIYDETGYILSIRQGEPAPRNPVGVPFLNVEIPSGKQIKITDGIGVDVSVTPHQVILEDIPPSEIEILKQRTEELEVIKQRTEDLEIILVDLMMEGGE